MVAAIYFAKPDLGRLYGTCILAHQASDYKSKQRYPYICKTGIAFSDCLSRSVRPLEPQYYDRMYSRETQCGS